MSSVRHIKADRAPAPRRPKTLERVLFDERMVMIRHLVGEAGAEEAKYYFSAMLEQCKFLSRTFGLKLNG